MRWFFKNVGRAPPAGSLVRLTPADGPGLIDHFLRLDPQSRTQRFGMPASDAFLRAYASRCLEFDEAVFGFRIDGEIRGAGELRNLTPEARDAASVVMEAAFSVEADWRGQGIGTRLMTSVVIAARGGGASALYLSCLPNNAVIQHMARKFDANALIDRTGADAMGRDRYATAVVAL